MAGDTADADQYNGRDLLITLTVFQVFTWISVALRTYVRIVLTKNFQNDDWFMLVSQVCGLALLPNSDKVISHLF